MLQSHSSRDQRRPSPPDRLDPLLSPESLARARFSFPLHGAIDLLPRVEDARRRLLEASLPQAARVAVVHEQGNVVAGLSMYLAALQDGFSPGLLRSEPTTDLAEYLRTHSFAAIIDSEEFHLLRADRRSTNGGRERLIVFTSGTTARPKGVCYSLEGLIHNLNATQSYLNVSADDHLALPLPVYYIYGLSCLNLMVRHGGAITFLDHRQPPLSWLAAVRAAKATILSLIPSQARLLLKATQFTGDYLPTLRAITLAGGALEPASVLALIDRFPEAAVYVMYGQTEAGPRASFVPPEDLPMHPNSIGKGIPGFVQLRLTNPGKDGVGELQVASHSLMIGYLDRDDPSPIDRDGWLSTGDLGYMDDDGFIVLVARCAPFFKPNDERVSYREILDVAHVVIPNATFRLEVRPSSLRGEDLVLTAVVADGRGRPEAEEYRRDFRRRLGVARAPAEVILRQRDESKKLE
jgi:acyl-CoA synthetase (AMP-forming)/AMP-acid ligase II